MSRTHAVLFDLDGTLLDTGHDMGAALNKLLRQHGREPLAYAEIRPKVSHGANALIKLGFSMEIADNGFDQLRQGFLAHYERDLCRYTTLFDGMSDVLSYLERRRLPWGIVTNKPDYLTRPLLQELGLLSRAACVVSGDTLKTRKPDPEPLLHGCRLTGSEPKSCMYIGDAERDIEAGNGAGMTTLIATFGYLSTDDRPETWGADGMVHHPTDILNWIRTGGRSTDGVESEQA